MGTLTKLNVGGTDYRFDAHRTQGIYYGEVDSTSTAKVFTATVPGITELTDGTCVLLRNGVVTSASGFTIEINGLGAKPSYSNMTLGNDITPTDPTRDTTIFNINYAMLFVYSSTVVSGGCWICYRGYDANTNTIGYQVRTNNSTLKAAQKFYRYRLLFTSADGTKWVPANTSTSTNATAKRDTNQTPIDPFGEIVWYGTTTAIEANATVTAAQLWQQYYGTYTVLGYSFNRTGAALSLTANLPLYIKCAPQANGSAIIDAETPYTQTLPSTEDGKIYIFLGRMGSATQFEITMNHPVYWYKDGAIRLWTGDERVGPKIFTGTNTDQGASLTLDNSLTVADVYDAFIEDPNVIVYDTTNNRKFEIVSLSTVGTAILLKGICVTGATIYQLDASSTDSTFTYSSNTFASSTHTHGNITNAGDITTTSTIASGDRIVINDESDSKITNSSITFGSSTTSFLANNGTWQTPAGNAGAFYATYDSTSGADIKAAYDADIAIYCIKSGYIYSLSSYQYNSTSDYGIVQFQGFGGTSNPIQTTIILDFALNPEWSSWTSESYNLIRVEDVKLDNTSVVSYEVASISTGTGLTSSSGTINHSNSVTAQTTQAVYPIKIDAQGHISDYGSAVTIPTVTDTYSSTSSNAMSGKAVNAALQTLDSSISATTGEAISAVTITDGKISASSKISVGDANQNAFSNVKVGSSTIAAASTTDTVELVAGTNITLTPDTTNKTVTVGVTNQGVTDVTVDGTSVVSGGTAAITSQWYKSSNNGLYRPYQLSNANTVIKAGAIASADYSRVVFSGTDAPINSMTAGTASLTLFGCPALYLTGYTSAGSTSYTFSYAPGYNLKDYNDYFMSIRWFTYNTPKETGALLPSSATYSSADQTYTLTFSTSLNPTSSINYLFASVQNNGNSSLAIGDGIQSNGYYSVNIGQFITSNNRHALNIGSHIYNGGPGAAIGYGLHNTGSCGIVVGKNNYNQKNYGALFGEGHNSSSGPNGVAAVGIYSSISSDTAFAVGVGTADNARSNAFEVHTDGRATIKTAPTANMDVANKKYVDDAVAGVSGGVSDVTVNGSSVVSSGVAAISMATVATSGSYSDLSNKPTDSNGIVTLSHGGTGLAANDSNTWYNSSDLHPQFHIIFNPEGGTFQVIYRGPLDGITSVSDFYQSDYFKAAIRSIVPIWAYSIRFMLVGTGMVTTGDLYGDSGKLYILFPDAFIYSIFGYVNGLKGTLVYDANDGIYIDSSTLTISRPAWLSATVQDVEVNGTSVVSSGTASITAVTDVEVNGTSVVSNGVANIPTKFTMTYDHSYQDQGEYIDVLYLDNGITFEDIYNAYILNPSVCLYSSRYGGVFYPKTIEYEEGGDYHFDFVFAPFGETNVWYAWAYGTSTDNTIEVWVEANPWGNVQDVTVNGSSVVSSGVAAIIGELTDTKNTAGSTDTSSKIYLVGATTQAANPQTYSDNQVYATNGQLDANKVRVAETATIQWNSTDSSLDFVFA